MGELAGSVWRFSFGTEGVGGWETLEMVQRYAHLSSGHLSEHASKIDAILERNGTNMAQKENMFYMKAR
ncbi:hypothetical protein GZ59_34730 [Pectobacterium atrosepticum]|nr:hypothetical protein EV46_17120 [Pectobacterium atrosepticum]AIK15225.1 hypothetical protein GZ59_34730 [Pectobacterium atrosepticum]KMK85052.1 Site-specific recombinase, phage integrase family protein [Pectobacterium atrosepticum ICMP 1526]POW24454.1 integrase [Pectobacterium atrosepticum]